MFADKTTLAYYDSLPQRAIMDLGAIPVSSVAINCRKAVDAAAGYGKKKRGPEEQALTFYALNHLVSLIRKKYTPNEPLPEWAQKIMEAYAKELSEGGLNMMYYLFLICTREARHFPAPAEYKEKLATEFGKTMQAYAMKLKALGSHASGPAAEMFMDKPCNTTLGNYTNALVSIFNEGGWPEKTSYGGKKWGKVAQCLADFVNGKISMEMMQDLAFALAHNGGPIFNKGMLYDHYATHGATGQPGLLPIFHILDVQRTGRIPELIRHGNIAYAPFELKELVASAMDQMPEDFGPEVDYHKVVAMCPPEPSYAYGNQIAAMKVKPVKKVGGKKIKETGTFQITPTQSVPIYERIKEPA